MSAQLRAASATRRFNPKYLDIRGIMYSQIYRLIRTASIRSWVYRNIHSHYHKSNLQLDLLDLTRGMDTSILKVIIGPILIGYQVILIQNERHY